MKKTYLLKGLLLAFIAFQFTACEDEPLTGEFQQEETDNEAEEGQFVAKVAGNEYVATTVSATINTDNEFIISGIKTGGENITLTVEDVAEGMFNLNGVGGSLNAGAYFDGSINILPYISASAFGGSGQLNITQLNLADSTVTGTFSFKGIRVKVDGTGNPILDGNGDPVLEDIEITNGSFNAIPFELDDTGGGGGGNGDPKNEFFAKVDGVDFVADTISVTEPLIGNVHMIKIEAKSANGELFRIDVPRSLGTGTFQMESISDGTKLIASYNAGNGAENLTSNPGTITITEFDLVMGVLKATFGFTGRDPLGQDPTVVDITEGSFTVYFEGVPGANDVFRANIDGGAYAPDELTITTSVVNGYPRITLTTMVGDQEMILTFPATLSEGSFDMGTEVVNGDESVAFYTPIVGTSIQYVSSPGVLTITNYDIAAGFIEGTFTYTAVDLSGQDPTVYQVTAGEFSAILP